MKLKLRYYLERSYPYLITVFVVVLIKSKNIVFINDSNFDKALTAVVTLDSIVIGFMGALMPIILSMKNESKFVKYVFEKDRKELFKKYLKITVITGIFNAGITIFLYLKNSFQCLEFTLLMETVWITSIILFLMLTLRSMEYMISLFFSKDDCLRNQGSEKHTFYNENELEESKNIFSED